MKRVHAETSMRVFANIVHSVTRSHACYALTIHACARTDNIASTRVFQAFAFDWVAVYRQTFDNNHVESRSYYRIL